MIPVRSFDVETSTRSQMVDITARVRTAMKQSGARHGVCVVYVPHTTAGITVNESADPAVAADILEHLEKLVPRAGTATVRATPTPTSRRA